MGCEKNNGSDLSCFCFGVGVGVIHRLSKMIRIVGKNQISGGEGFSIIVELSYKLKVYLSDL